MATRQIESIELTANSDREFFLIHGYTGSPTDFQQLPYLLNEKFNAHVRVILLSGHGTKVEDLDDVTYEDLFNQLTVELEKDIKKGRDIMLGGVSLGGLFSLLLAADYPVKGVFNVSSPHVFKFPFNLVGLEIFARYIKYWKKFNTSAREKELRQGSFSYPYMHRNGLGIVKRANKELRARMSSVTVPTLTIQSTADLMVHRDSLGLIHENVGAVIKKAKMFSVKPHSVFFSAENNEVYKEILNFVESNNIFPGLSKRQKKVAAIIPAYNEAERITAVLEAVTAVPNIDDVIVIDDGSADNTEEVVKKFDSVRYLRNEINLGKAAALDRGVQSTDAEILFFCDADLIGLSPEMIQNIISPVTDGLFAMFVGLRGNLMQRAIHLFAINSGERALIREVWEKLPHYFKYKYRVEAGLNYCVKKYFGGFGFKTFNYSQPIKEKKYGFIRGTFLRWSMNLDVLAAYLREMVG